MAFLGSHRADLDSTFDAFVSMFRILNVLPQEHSDGSDGTDDTDDTDDDSSETSPTPDATHALSNGNVTSSLNTQVNGIGGRLGYSTTTMQTPDDGPDGMPYHGNGGELRRPRPSAPSWVTAYHARESAMRTAAQRPSSAVGMQTTATTAPLHQNGVHHAPHLNGNGSGHLTARQAINFAESHGSFLPQTTYTPPAVPDRLDAQNLTSLNGNGAHHAAEELSDSSLEGNNDSVVSTTNPTIERNVFQLPIVIDGGSPAHFQTTASLTLPRFGNMSLGSVDDE